MDPQLRFAFVDDASINPHPAQHVGMAEHSPTLYVRESSNYIALTDEQILDHARRLLGMSLRRGHEVFQSTTAIRDFLRFNLSRLDYEVFGCLYLDTRNRFIKMEELFRGTIDTATVHSREVVKAVIHCAASVVVLYHNHPSGSPEPSSADEYITRRLSGALALIDVTVLDHLIVGDLAVYSFSEHGLL